LLAEQANKQEVGVFLDGLGTKHFYITIRVTSFN